jgi:epoxyqueuosine reductase QueG
MSEEKNTDMLINISRDLGASLFGVASLKLLEERHHLLSHRLLDKFPFAISIGYHLSDSIIDEIENEPTQLYFNHYQRINILLDTIGLIITTKIQESGYQAMPIPASQIVDWKNQKGLLSHKHVGKIAGLGWIGRNNLLVNKRFGSRIRLVSILTDFPLILSSPSQGNCGACKDCIKVCPVGAISERQEDFNHLACYEQLRTFAKTLHFSHNICGICVKACRGQY